MIWNPIERLLWGITITFLVSCSIQYMIKGRKRENFNERIILYGYAGLLLGISFTRFYPYSITSNITHLKINMKLLLEKLMLSLKLK